MSVGSRAGGAAFWTTAAAFPPRTGTSSPTPAPGEHSVFNTGEDSISMSVGSCAGGAAFWATTAAFPADPSSAADSSWHAA